jgi:hypothetical protein
LIILKVDFITKMNKNTPKPAPTAAKPVASTAATKPKAASNISEKPDLKKNPSTASTVVSSTSTKAPVNKPPLATNIQKVDPIKNVTKPATTTTTAKATTTNSAVKQPSTSSKNPTSTTKAPIGTKGAQSGSSTSRSGVKAPGTPQVNKGKNIPGSGSEKNPAV